MSLAVAAPTLFDQFEERVDRQPDATVADRVTLDSLIVTTWREIRVHGVSVCPICACRMMRADATLARGVDVAAICEECGTEIV